MDTNNKVDMLTLLYDRPLKSLIGYKDTAFTVELVKYMFMTFDDLAKQDDKFKQFNNVMGEELDKYFRQHNERFDYTYRESYIKYIHAKFSVPPTKKETRNGKQDIRKDLSDYFHNKVENDKNEKLKALGIDFYSYRSLLTSALVLRNEKSHRGSCGDTKLYKEFEYLYNYLFLMEYLLYAFYHMVFSGSHEHGSLFNMTDSLPVSDMNRHVENSCEPFKDELKENKTFGHMMHVYADYLFEPFAGLLFKKFFSTPYRLKNEAYNTLADKVAKLNKSTGTNQPPGEKIPQPPLSPEDKKFLKEYGPKLDNINGQWKMEWRKELITAYSKKLLDGVLPSEREHYQREYFDLYSNILIVKYRDKTTESLTLQFLYLMKDYLLRNSPSAVDMSEYTPLKEVLQKIRSDYSLLHEHQFHIPMETNRYASTLLDHMECLAEKRERYPAIGIFLGLMDCLMGQTLYIYMTELLRYVQNPHDESNFINVMKGKDIMKWTDATDG